MAEKAESYPVESSALMAPGKLACRSLLALACRQYTGLLKQIGDLLDEHEKGQRKLQGYHYDNVGQQLEELRKVTDAKDSLKNIVRGEEDDFALLRRLQKLTHDFEADILSKMKTANWGNLTEREAEAFLHALQADIKQLVRSADVDCTNAETELWRAVTIENKHPKINHSVGKPVPDTKEGEFRAKDNSPAKRDVWSVAFCAGWVFGILAILCVIAGLFFKTGTLALFFFITLLTAGTSVACVVGGVFAIYKGAVSDTKFKMFGLELSSQSIGVAFMAIGIVVGYFTVTNVLDKVGPLRPPSTVIP